MIDQYLEELSPLIQSAKRKSLVTIPIAYEDLMEVLSHEKAKEFKEELLGNSIVEGAPAEYWMIGLAEKHGGYGEFIDYPIDLQARIIARSQLSGMLDILSEYQRRMKKKLNDKLKGTPNG